MIDNNYCVQNGAAIYAIHSDISISNTTISNNRAYLSGGGVYLLFSDIVVNDDNQNTSSIESNQS